MQGAREGRGKVRDPLGLGGGGGAGQQRELSPRSQPGDDDSDEDEPPEPQILAFVGETTGTVTPALPALKGKPLPQQKNGARLLRQQVGPVIEEVSRWANGDAPADKRWNTMEIAAIAEGEKKVCRARVWGCGKRSFKPAWIHGVRA